MGLGSLQKRLLDELKDGLSVIAACHATAQIGEVYEDVEEHFHAIACCKLLGSSDKPGFQRYLFWAALTRRYFLERSRAEGSSDDFRCARSRSQGFFCAVAAGDVPLALEIGELSPDGWLQDGEYEDDFAYHHFLHLVLKGAEGVLQETSLNHLERALDGETSPRLDMCRALRVRDTGRFKAAFRDLVEQHSATQNEERHRFTDVPTFEPLSRLFTEGFALMRIAHGAGILLPKQSYPLCPVSGRLAPLRKRPDDLFADLAAIQA